MLMNTNAKMVTVQVEITCVMESITVRMVQMKHFHVVSSLAFILKYSYENRFLKYKNDISVNH